MLAILYAVYQVTFEYSEIPVHWLETGIASLSSLMERLLPPGPLKSLVISGIIAGAGGCSDLCP